MRYATLIVLIFLPAFDALGGALPAFPGAQGFGADTPGGRGGRVLFVTTLQDYLPDEEAPIPGSLREACLAEGPRVVLFRVSGTIALKAPLHITNPYLTMAGQSSPGGICLRDQETRIGTHDVVVRHMRFRLGDDAGEAMDSLSLRNAQRAVIDHCSASWGIDETLSVTNNSRDVTVQWCFITEALHESHHPKGNHGYGSIIAGRRGGVTFHHNLYAHHRSRNPRPGGYEGAPGIVLDFRNNVVYNWGNRAGYSGEHAVRVNLVANFYRPGPNTRDRGHIFTVGGPATRLYLAGNILDGDGGAREANGEVVRGLRPPSRASRPFVAPELETQPAERALAVVLDHGGATRPQRDVVDARIVRSVRGGEGAHIDSQSEVGGWPDLPTPEPLEDSDRDGMPDDWEALHGLPPDRAAPSGDADNDGYTDLEEYLNDTDPNEPHAG